MDEYKEKFTAFLKSLGIQKIEELIEKDKEFIENIGKRIELHAKIGAKVFEICYTNINEFYDDDEESRN